jgi:hypothetical protein
VVLPNGIKALLRSEETFGALEPQVLQKAFPNLFGGGVIPPFLMGLSCRIHAAVFSFIAGVMPPMPMLGRTLL